MTSTETTAATAGVATHDLPTIPHWIEGAERPSTATASGARGFDFFTREKAITSRWLDPATRHRSDNGGLNIGIRQNT
jgi:hypothetical protein